MSLIIENYESNLLLELSKQLNLRLEKIKKDGIFLNKIQDEIETRIVNSKEYQSILYGKLRAEFGLLSPDSVLPEIVQALKQSVRLEYELDNNCNGFFRVIISSQYFITTAGEYFSNEYLINWLDWILTAGTDIIVSDYQIIYGDFEQSRSGQAIMVQGGGWSVPSEYAGVDNSNWFTRELNGIENFIFDLFFEIF